MNDQQPVEILLVEDNPADIELTVRSLKSHNLSSRLHVVRDGEAAIEYLFSEGRYEGDNARNTPRLVLLDIKLPKVDGIEVLRRAKGDDRTKTIPIVILTSSNEDKDIAAAYALGVNSYIVKPVGFGNFTAAVTELGLYWMLLNRAPDGTGR